MFKEKDVLNWMDNQIKAYKLSDKVLYDEENDLDISNIALHSNEIHVNTDGMLEIVKIPKLKECVKIVNREHYDEYPYYLITFYKGFKFFTLLSEEEYQQYKANSEI